MQSKSLSFPYNIFMLVACFLALGILTVDVLWEGGNETKTFLTYVDYGLSAFFLTDFLCRFCFAKGREGKWKYLWNDFGWVDLLSCVPAFGWGRVARVVRIFKIFKSQSYLAKIFPALNRNRSQSALWAMLTFLLIGIMYGTVAILQFELHGGIIHNAGDALWWTTCMILKGECDGFDSPVSAEGRFISVSLVVMGEMISATLIGFIATLLLEPKPELGLKLLKAVKEADVEQVGELLRQGADVDTKGEDDNTPLHYAVEHPKLVQILLEADADVSAKNSTGESPLHHAAKGNTETVKLLLAKNADPNGKDFKGATPLHQAALAGNTENVRLLLEAGADVKAKDSKAVTALHYAAFKASTEMIRLLVESGADVNAITNGPCAVSDHPLHAFNGTPLRAAFCGFFIKSTAPVIPLLFQLGADPNRKNVSGVPPLATFLSNYASLLPVNFQLKTFNPFLQAGADLNAKDNDGTSLLHNAVSSGLLKIASLLIQKGADVNAKDNDDAQTPLHSAAIYGRSEMVNLLLQSGADVHVKDKEGKTALFWASCMGYTEIVEALLKAGAEVNATTNDGMIPLRGALDPEIAQMLIQAGAEVNSKDTDGDNSLNGAALYGQAEVVELLLKSGAEVNITNNNNETALHNATQKGHTEIVKILLEAGANTGIENKDGETVLQWAEKNDRPEIVALLRDFEKKNVSFDHEQ